MLPDPRDTIVASAAPPGGGARGIARLTGPDAMAVVRRLIGEPIPGCPCRLAGRTTPVLLAGPSARGAARAPVDAFVWPGERSYTRQPSAELHTVGSPPVIDALVRAACHAGARLAEPGEFTLRALLAGRIDLTQAEAVLGVIDAPNDDALRAALSQLSGGLATPLAELRADLIDLLAELEAGLDFVEEEDVRFVGQEDLLRRIDAARSCAESIATQSTARAVRRVLPRVVLFGPPNAGKSSLWNAMVARLTPAGAPRPVAIISPVAGTTRDAVTVSLEHRGVRFELADTAGADCGAPGGGLDAEAQRMTHRVASDADLLLHCVPAPVVSPPALGARSLLVVTKADLAPGIAPPVGGVATSVATGLGAADLADAIAARLAEDVGGAADLLRSTADRCGRALVDAAEGLAEAGRIAPHDQPELVAHELRAVLEALGRVTGAVATDDLLGRIFSRFCIGK